SLVAPSLVAPCVVDIWNPHISLQLIKNYRKTIKNASDGLNNCVKCPLARQGAMWSSQVKYIDGYRGSLVRCGFVLAGAAMLMALTGCSHLPPASAYRLSGFDIRTADLSRLHAAVRLPRPLSLGKNGARLEFGIKIDGEMEEARHIFVLEQIDDEAQRAALAGEEAPDAHIFVFRFPPADLGDIARSREEIGRLKARHGDRAHGFLSIGTDACLNGPLPPGALLVTTYLRPDPQTGYVVIARDLDMRTLMGDNLPKIPPC
ncbi:MAG: hypothetical protein KDJ46_00955, partial [Rhodobiaceae bacterium]|nr:hypothetical protein [Rhodobiaceae bacterium]